MEEAWLFRYEWRLPGQPGARGPTPLPGLGRFLRVWGTGVPKCWWASLQGHTWPLGRPSRTADPPRLSGPASGSGRVPPFGSMGGRDQVRLGLRMQPEVTALGPLRITSRRNPFPATGYSSPNFGQQAFNKESQDGLRAFLFLYF